MFTKTLAAVAAGTMLATSAFAQERDEVRIIVPVGRRSRTSPHPSCSWTPPLPEALARGAAVIPYRVENFRILPVLGMAAVNVSPRVGHLHVTVDDLPWYWGDFSNSNTVVVTGLPLGEHKVTDPAGRPDAPHPRHADGDVHGVWHRAARALKVAKAQNFTAPQTPLSKENIMSGIAYAPSRRDFLAGSAALGAAGLIPAPLQAASSERSRDDLAGKLTRRVIQRAPLSVAGREIVQVETEIPAGVESGWHVHPGEEVGYIIAGEVEMMVQGRANVVLHAGDGFLIPPEIPHNARDLGPETGRMLSTYIVEPGQPLATFVDRHAHK